MKFDDIKERHVYYVNFNPYRNGEFNENHLSVVLKKNNDKKTVIVIPLTSKSNGVGKNKILIDIPNLPKRLKGKNSYAVYNQVRTVNTGRLQRIYENNLTDKDKIVDVTISDENFLKLIKMSTVELEKKLTLDEKIELNRSKFNQLCNEKIVNLAYTLKKETSEEKKLKLRTEIESILYNKIEYTFNDREKEDGIENIINSILVK